MAVAVPSISCCIFINHNSFYYQQTALAFNQNTCGQIVLCLLLISIDWTARFLDCHRRQRAPLICISIYKDNDASLQQKPMFKSQNCIFELCRKVRRIKIALSFKTKFILFTFTLLPSISLFLYCIKIHCYIGMQECQ